MASKKAAFHTLGCRLNQSETEVLSKSLQTQGYQTTSQAEQADIHVINTCTVTQHSDAKGRQLIRSIHKKNPKAKIAVVGCYAQMEPEEIKALPGVQWVVGNEEKLNIHEWIQNTSDEPQVINPKIKRQTFHTPIFQLETSTTRAYLKIQDGCDFMCSFCIIPFSRGRSRCRTLENLLEEAKTLIASGAKEIVLTGVNVGTYQDEDKHIAHVVDALQALPELERIRISSIEPTTIPSVLFEYMADPQHKLVPFLHIPLQSGSNKVLQQMKRRYSAKAFIEEVQQAMEQVPHLGLGTDVMVGFPDESDEEFGETVQLLQSLPFAYFHVFPFSERKGTPAIRIQNKVTPEEKQRRGAVLRHLSDQKRHAFYSEYLGSTQTVLFETPKKDGSISGYTPNYIRVTLHSHEPEQLKNQLVPVKLMHIEDDVVIGQIE